MCLPLESILRGGCSAPPGSQWPPTRTIGVGSRQQVHVLQADGTLKAIEVVTGQSDGRLTAVTSRELKPGMKVVTGIKADEE